jgi:hypothetical protein
MQCPVLEETAALAVVIESVHDVTFYIFFSVTANGTLKPYIGA